MLITGFELFRDHLVVAERHAGLTRLRVRRWDGPEHHIAFDEAAYAVSIDTNREPETTTLRFHYSSLTTPPSVYDYDMQTRDRTLLKREAVLGDFDPARYETERLFATASDGERVPISLVRRKPAAAGAGSPDPPAAAARAEGADPPPLLLYGYGAYGISMEPTFRSARLSLLDRGFTYAIAHVRGGEELGRRWYDDGKLRNKKNTFTDFITCAEHLVAAGRTAPERLFAMGGSAGGLLMGAVVNLRPDLFHGVVAQVPFVDVVTTMLDESIPLTTGEYDEWGNPERTGGLRLHPVLVALRQHGAGHLAAPAGDDRPARFAGAVLGAGEVGGPAPRAAAGRRPAVVAEDQHGCRARRCLRALPAVSGDRAPVRLPAGPGAGRPRAGGIVRRESMETGRRAFVGALGAAAAAGALPAASAASPTAGAPTPAEPGLAPAGTVSGQAAAVEGIEAFAFDAYGTLFDVFSVTALCDELFPGSGDALAQRWRAKQLQYSLLRSLMGRHRDFWLVTQDALVYAARSLDLDLTDARRTRLMDAYLTLEAFPDVRPGLEALRARGVRLAILSNGEPRMLEAAARSAGIDTLLDTIISVEEVRIFKVSPRVYNLGPERLGVDRSALGFVSSNAWDIAGAASAGLTTFWIQRSAAEPPDELGFAADRVVAAISDLPGLLGTAG